MSTRPLQIENKVNRKVSSPTIQPKLTIGAANDKYEREADAMANHIMRMPQIFSSQPLSKGANDVQRKCAACDLEEEKIQRKPLMLKSEGGTLIATSSLGSQLNSTKGSGSPLPATTNSFMNNAFGTDFSNVRIHTGGSAIQMNQGLNARAFTHGSDIYFNQGQYQPGSFKGRRLLGHELTHVVQQNGSNKTQAQGLVQRAPPTSEEETEPMSPLEVIVGGVLRDEYTYHELRAQLEPLTEEEKEGLLEFFYVEFPHEMAVRVLWDLLFDRDVDRVPLGEEAQSRASGSGRFTDEKAPGGKVVLSRRIKRVYNRWAKKGSTGQRSPLQCMNAGYQGLDRLISPEILGPCKNANSAQGASVTRLAHLLRQYGAVGERIVFNYKAKKGSWEPDFEDKLLEVTATEKEPGMYFFLVSLHAHHMVLIMVDRRVIDKPKLFFLDQFGGFLTYDEDGKPKGSKNLSLRSGITKEAKTFSGRFNPTIMWPIMPPLEKSKSTTENP